MRKVALKPGERHCLRCCGYGIFYVGTLNGRGVPAPPWNGTCYRCKGSGREGPRFTERQKEAMRKVFGAIYANEISRRPVYISYADIAEQLRFTVKFTKQAVGWLVECQYAEIERVEHIDYVNATPLGMKRFSQFV